MVQLTITELLTSYCCNSHCFGLFGAEDEACTVSRNVDNYRLAPRGTPEHSDVRKSFAQ
jgi:hypothetical protein